MSSAERTRHNTFGDTRLERCGERRADPVWMAAQRSAAAARFLVHDDQGAAPVEAGRLCWLGAAAVAPDAPTNFLGVLADEPVFALRDAVPHTVFPDAQWVRLRAAAALLEGRDAGLLAYAQGLANWQGGTRYCASCGGGLILFDGGHRARCTRCGREHFPRTDAAIIVVVEQGDACLLGRQARWRAHQYSTLAGFVEPGEPLADAVRREVHEETGVRVLDCDFHSSQPWPFPASLMLGFMATAAGRDISLADGELEQARWFTPRDIVAGLGDGSLRLPPRVSISHRLIEHWLRTRAGLELDALPHAMD